MKASSIRFGIKRPLSVKTSSLRKQVPSIYRQIAEFHGGFAPGFVSGDRPHAETSVLPPSISPTRSAPSRALPRIGNSAESEQWMAAHLRPLRRLDLALRVQALVDQRAESTRWSTLTRILGRCGERESPIDREMKVKTGAFQPGRRGKESMTTRHRTHKVTQSLIRIVRDGFAQADFDRSGF
jgi:hypothetical protein